MIKETIQLTHIDSKSFGQFIQEIIRKELSEYKVNTQEEKEYYTREEAAKLLNVSYPTLFQWNRDGILKARKIGKRVYYSKEDVKEALNRRDN
ncbi:DNA-binding protein [Elizabethkingia anophelis]|uniref:helix-turn-helix domain-containing protein n=1 Tax=Elizabethkingia anophelis TaxID=1117645 RepID=UPI002935E040|nr:DNA-binding protein [Elizabethkingia anophelis]MDV3471506.1 DNA-binding protein [Elizabethkingia anophelis]MDV3903464.1 DNA-binding protein [Elizabethkingia anophelis]